MCFTACSDQADYETQMQETATTEPIVTEETVTTTESTEPTETTEAEIGGYPKFEDLNCNYCCYIVSMTEDGVCFHPMEFIGGEDTERIQELELTENDMVSGYYLLDENGENIEMPFAEDAEFIFVDWNHEYYEEDNLEIKEKYQDVVTWDRSMPYGRIKTKEVSIFREYLSTYGNSLNRQPFFVIVENGAVKCIFELWMA